MRLTFWQLLTTAALICVSVGCTVRREPQVLIEPSFSYLQPSRPLDERPVETEPIGSVAALEEVEVR